MNIHEIKKQAKDLIDKYGQGLITLGHKDIDMLFAGANSASIDQYLYEAVRYGMLKEFDFTVSKVAMIIVGSSSLMLKTAFALSNSVADVYKDARGDGAAMFSTLIDEAAVEEVRSVYIICTNSKDQHDENIFSC